MKQWNQPHKKRKVTQLIAIEYLYVDDQLLFHLRDKDVSVLWSLHLPHGNG